MIYLGAQNDPEIGPLGPIFNTLLKVAQIDMYTKTDAQPVGYFEKMTEDRNFDLFGDPNWASVAHILHTSKSTWNEHVKQYCCEPVKTF